MNSRRTRVTVQSLVGFLWLVSPMMDRGTVRGADIPVSPAQTRPLEADEVAKLEPAKLKELLIKGQDLIEVSPRLDGVLVIDLRLGDADEERLRKLELKGKVRQAAQRPLVAKAIVEAMQAESFWNTQDDEFTVDTGGLAVTEPSAEMRAKNLSAALVHFWAGQYEPADGLFTRALAEAPGREVIHYWKAVNAIALKQPERAERRLEVLSRRNPAGSTTHAGQMQRLQGPLRQALIQMETKVMLRNRLGEPTPIEAPAPQP